MCVTTWIRFFIRNVSSFKRSMNKLRDASNLSLRPTWKAFGHLIVNLNMNTSSNYFHDFIDYFGRCKNNKAFYCYLICLFNFIFAKSSLLPLNRNSSNIFWFLSIGTTMLSYICLSLFLRVFSIVTGSPLSTHLGDCKWGSSVIVMMIEYWC